MRQIEWTTQFKRDYKREKKGRHRASLDQNMVGVITADEVMRLKAPVKDKDGKILEAGDMLIFSAGYPPVYGQQILYFQDPYFQKRAEVHEQFPTPFGYLWIKMRIFIAFIDIYGYVFGYGTQKRYPYHISTDPCSHR